MDPRKLSFLQAVIGADGASALVKAASKSPDLEWAIVPRVVMAWLDVIGHSDGYKGEVPGVGNKLMFKKHERGYSGYVNFGDDDYTFEAATVYHLAGCVAVALGGMHEKPPELRSPSLAKLGKSIDLLVKARTLRKAQQSHQGGAKGVRLPGAAAMPRPPQGPQEPVAVQPTNTGANAVGTKAGTAMKPSRQSAAPPKSAPGSAPKLPGMKPPMKKPQLKVTKAEARAACAACGGRPFRAERYAGCICFADLAKSVKTTPTDTGFTLEFGAGWDADAVATLAESLKG